tara:strand:+ start:368 stop:1096 length:729 start_codon:yes stop_codon:yes gene_type:complete
MVELKMEHVLILVIVVFILHSVGRCNCFNGNSFSVSGDKDNQVSRDDPPIFPTGEFPLNPICYGALLDNIYTKNKNVLGCQSSDPRCRWDYDYINPESGGHWEDGYYGACRMLCNEKLVESCTDAKTKDECAISRTDYYQDNDNHGDVNCDWQGSSCGSVGAKFRSYDCMTIDEYKDMIDKYVPKCATDSWAPLHFYQNKSGEKYCECPIKFNKQTELIQDDTIDPDTKKQKDLWRCILPEK